MSLLVGRNWLGRMISPGVGLAAALIGANAASADGPPADRPAAAQRRAPVPAVAPAARPGLVEIKDASPLLSVFNAPRQAESGAPAPTPLQAPDFSRVGAIAPVDRASEPTPDDAQAPGAAEPAVEVATHDWSGAPSASPSPEIASPDLPAIDIPLPPPIPEPANGALANPLPIAIEAAIERLILHDDAPNPLGAGDWRNARAAIGAFYAAREYQPVWVDENGLTQAGRSALSQLARAEEDGLNLSAFVLPRDVDAGLAATTLARLETTIAAAVVAYAEQASGSRVPPARISRLITDLPDVADPGAALAETAAAPDPAARLAQFNPPQKGYRDLREELKRSLEAVPIGSGSHTTAPALDLDMSATPARAVGVNSELAAAAGSRIDAARRRAKGRPAVGAVTASANAAFAFGPLSRQRAAILANMEMWRWEPRDMGERRIEINVPDFSVSVLDGDTVLRRARVIVGKPDTPTPIFSNVMRYVLINPSWQVPDSIIRKEILPKLASDPDYLARHGYEMKTVGGRITVRQPPGEDNALGRIAFMFPNEHAVYLHDTPSRRLFSAEITRVQPWLRAGG